MNLTPIVLYNNTSSASPAPFQQMLIIPANTSINSTYTNIRFRDGNYKLLTSWLESYTTSSATIWIVLPNGISSKSAMTIYMETGNLSDNFLDGVTVGEAPQLSGTYGQYDNGVKVFLAYFNGNTPISDFNYYSQYIQVFQSTAILNGKTINVINVSRVATGTFIVLIAEFVLNSAIQNQSLYVEGQTYLQATSVADNPKVGLLNNSSPEYSSIDAIAVNVGWAGAYFQQEIIQNGSYTPDINPGGSEAVGWVFSGLLYISGASTYYGYTAPQLYSDAGGYSGTTTNTIPSSGDLFIGGIGGPNSSYPVQANTTQYNWMRARAYPPNGTMPIQVNELSSTVNITEGLII